MDSLPVTQETFDKLVKSLENLKKVTRPRVLQELIDARAQGDLSENAEYSAAKEELAKIDAEMPVLEDQIARAKVIKFDTNSDVIKFGATVTVKNVKTGKEIVYQLVSPEGVDAINGKISFTSPIGKALMGASRGKTVSVTTPRGVNQFEILDFK
jgi:transcription elongation factor GreA